MKWLSLILMLSITACAEPPKRHYPTRSKCPALRVLPDPATSEDKDAWISDAAAKYAECAKSRRVFTEPK